MLSRFGQTLTRLLRRETASTHFVPQIDGLRFFAILLVMLHHLDGYCRVKSPVTFNAPPSESLLSELVHAARGRFGVQLFFAISGFIVALPFARHFLNGAKRVSLRDYFTRRVTRIEPPYFICLTVMYFFMLLAQSASGNSQLFLHYAVSLGYLHGSVYRAVPLLINAGWSLEMEVQFYLIAPLLTLVFAVRAAWARRAILGVAVAAFALLQGLFPGEWIYLTLLAQFHYFVVGLLLADLFCVDWKSPARFPWAWDAAALLAWAAAGFALLHPSAAADLALPAATFVIYVAAFRGRIWRRIVSLPALYLIGGMCYTIYLYHFQLISAAGRWTIRVGFTHDYTLNLLFQAALLALPVLAGCAVLYLLFEKPFMIRHWPSRLVAWLRGGRMAPTAESARLPPPIGEKRTVIQPGD